jgi:hypothetical protein
MTIEQRISNLESRLDSLQESFIQSQKNAVEVTAKADVGYNKPDAPYTATQTAYYGESEKVFYNVPQGNISVFFNNYNGNYKINRISDRVLVTFDTLKDYTNIKIMVQ